MKKLAVVVIYSILVTGLAFGRARAAAPIRIGVLLPLTGSMASYGQIQKNSALMAAGEINAGGGVSGKKIGLIFADTQGTPYGGRAAVEKLITRENVPVIGGGFSSSATWATSAIAQQNRVPFVVTSAAADKISEQNREFIFRLNQPLSEHLNGLASFISTLPTDLKSVAIVHAGSLKSSAAARRFFKKATALGLQPIIRERLESGVDDFSPVLIRVQAKNPDLIYAVTDDVKNAARLVRQTKGLELNPKLFVGGGDEFLQPEFAARAGKASDRIVSPALWSPALPYRGAGEFHQKFIDRYKTHPGHYGAESYAGIYVIVDALKRTNVLTPANIRDALAQTEMTTVLGPIKFSAYDRKSQQNKLPAYLAQWSNTKLEIIWPPHLATKKAAYPCEHSDGR